MMEQELNISLDKTTEMVCDECNNPTFKQVLLLRKASRFVTGTAQDALIPVPLFACDKCGHVNESFLPLSLKNETNNV